MNESASTHDAPVVTFGILADASNGDDVALSAHIFDSAPLGMAFVDADHRVLWVNSSLASMVGAVPADLIGTSLLDLVHPDERDVARSAAAELFAAAGGSYDRQERWRGGPDDVLVVKVHGTLAVDLRGEPLLVDGSRCAVLQVLDVTEAIVAAEALEQTNEELRRSNEELQRFAYVASHDLKEPLRVVSGHVDLLARRLDDGLDEQSREWMGYVVDGARRMRDLIDDLLTYSRVHTQRRDDEPVDLAEVAERVVRAHGAAIEDAEATVHIGTLHAVHGDSSQLSQVLANLVSNGLRYRAVGAGPRLAISSRRDGDQVLVSVIDNGMGIAPEHRDRAFQMFKRLHPRDDHTGTGMGLALCRRIVEGHGGRIWIDDGDDGGISVRFTLPAVSPRTATTTTTRANDELEPTP